MTMRYNQLLSAVRAKQPKTILEIGTWNGMRALQMLTLCPTAKYYGFDLFEDANEQTDSEELNVKKHHALTMVADKLAGFDVVLIKGNTRETLKNFNPPEKIDFVWLDGGHSVGTIKSDWENVQRVIAPDAWVFFDDYIAGPAIDTTRFGCNEIVKGLKHEVLPQADWMVGGGTTQMVRVYPQGE